MVFENIEKLKKEYTDKYVLIDESRPELLRFRGLTGTVRTVNMSGRALVEFDGNNNIGWYDIDIDYLKVIDKPLPKADEKPAPKAKAAPKKAPAAKAPSELEKARGGGAGKMSVAEMMAAARSADSGGAKKTADAKAGAEPAKPAAADKPAASMSVAEMLAAARSADAAGGAKAAPAAAPKKAESETDVAAIMEAARKKKDGAAGPAATAPQKVDAGKMSVAEMIAAARRADGAGGDAAAAPAAEPAAEPEQTAAPKEEAATEEVAAEEPVAASGGSGSKKDEITSVEDQIAYCRNVDG